jgi:uncharacterized integral membrane protein
MSNSTHTPQKKEGKNLNFLFIIGLIFCILIIVFGLANQEVAEIDFLVFKLEINLVLLIFLCIALGAILTLLFSLPGVFRRRKIKIALEKELKDLRLKYEELAKINSTSTR